MKLYKYLFLFLAGIICCLSAFSQIDTLSDEFDDPGTLSNWNRIYQTEGWDEDQLEVLDINQTHAGQLVMIPYTVVWYADYRGPLLYKNVSGDFVFTTEVEASNRAGDSYPGSDYSLAGVMVRAPKTMTNGENDWVAGQENYVFLSVGFGSTSHPSCTNCFPPHFEVKTTVNSNSDLRISEINSLKTVICVARMGEYLIMLRQTPGENMVVHRRYHRDDFPDNLQVGLVTYTDWPKASTFDVLFQNNHQLDASVNASSNNPGLAFTPDLKARFEYARFKELEVPAHWAGWDLSNESLVSDDSLIWLVTSAKTDGITDLKESHSWKIFPNPGKEQLFLQAKDVKPGRVEVEIFDLHGRLILAEKYDSSISEMKISTSVLSTGLYVIWVRNDGESQRFKWVKR